MTSTRRPEPGLELVAVVTVDLAPPISLGAGPLGDRRVIGITGGTVSGPQLNGAVVPGGADWQIVAPGGVAIIDTRYTLRTDDGAFVNVATKGRRVASAEVLESLLGGEQVDPTTYYFRQVVDLETGDPRYEWLNRHVFIGVAARFANSVQYDLYKVL